MAPSEAYYMPRRTEKINMESRRGWIAWWQLRTLNNFGSCFVHCVGMQTSAVALQLVFQVVCLQLEREVGLPRNDQEKDWDKVGAV